MNGNLIQMRSIKQGSNKINVSVATNDVTIDLNPANIAVAALGSGVATDYLPVSKGGSGVGTSTGSGNNVLSTSPTLTTPVLGAATATSINSVTITTSAGSTFTLFAGSTLATGAAFALTLTAQTNSNFTFPNQATGAVLTADSANTLTNKTFNTGGVGNVFQIAGTSISAVTGTGSVALSTSPSFTTPTLGVAAATTINKITLTAPATGATLTLVDGSTLTTAGGAYNLTLTTAQTGNFTFPTQAAGTLLTADSTATVSNKTINTASNTFSINGTAVTTSVPVTVGGTGATTAIAARTNLNPANGFGLPAKYAADCSTVNPWTIAAATHLLGATQDLQVYVYEKSTGTQVFADVTVSGTGDISIALGATPTAAQFRAVVIG
jgi:hypothetical protein